jgi:predicted cupin superfamily sugar epimerase
MQIKNFIKAMQCILGYSDYKAGTKEVIENFIQYLNNLSKDEQLLSDRIIALLNLIDLSTITSEEGFFSEFVKTEDLVEEINHTVIFYLIKDQQASCWHSLDTTETWRWIAGCDVIISILTEDKINEVVLNAQNPCFKIEKGTLFGARNNLTVVKERDNFGLVTCECIPGFKPELYSNPTKEQLATLSDLYKKDMDKKIIIERLIPKTQLEYFNELKSVVRTQFFLPDTPPNTPEKKGSSQTLMATNYLSN